MDIKKIIEAADSVVLQYDWCWETSPGAVEDAIVYLKSVLKELRMEMPTNVYVVLNLEEDIEILGIYSSKEKALTKMTQFKERAVEDYMQWWRIDRQAILRKYVNLAIPKSEDKDNYELTQSLKWLDDKLNKSLLIKEYPLDG